MTEPIRSIDERGILRSLELDVRPAESDALAPKTAEELAAQQPARAALSASLAQLPVHNPNDGWDSSRADEIVYGWKK